MDPSDTACKSPKDNSNAEVPPEVPPKSPPKPRKLDRDVGDLTVDTTFEEEYDVGYILSGDEEDY